MLFLFANLRKKTLFSLKTDEFLLFFSFLSTGRDSFGLLQPLLFLPSCLQITCLVRQKGPYVHFGCLSHFGKCRISVTFAEKIKPCDMKNIGERIKTVLFSQKHTAKWLAEQLSCERTNVYDIFKRKDMNIRLLQQISAVLNHDFFKELSDETFSYKK